jgi:hypothetical protein
MNRMLARFHCLDLSTAECLQHTGRRPPATNGRNFGGIRLQRGTHIPSLVGTCYTVFRSGYELPPHSRVLIASPCKNDVINIILREKFPWRCQTFPDQAPANDSHDTTAEPIGGVVTWLPPRSTKEKKHVAGHTLRRPHIAHRLKQKTWQAEDHG